MALPLVRIIFGGLLLFLGRRLFWLFAAIVGFIFGMQLAGQWLTAWPVWMQLLAAVVFGFIMAILAVVSVRFAAMLVGFVAGWLIVAQVLAALGFDAGLIVLLLDLLGGIAGAALTLVFFDLAIIVLSSLAGASTIANALGVLLGPTTGGPLLLIVGALLAVVGIVVQLRDMNSRAA